MRYLAALGGLVVASMLVLGGSALAETTVYNSTSESILHPEGLYISVTNPKVTNSQYASFQTGPIEAAIQSLTLELTCNDGNGETAKCGAGSYTAPSGETVVSSTTTGNTTVVTLSSSVAGYQVGDLVQGAGIVANEAYVAAISGKTITLNAPTGDAITVTKGATISYLHQGSVTVSLDTNTGSSPIPGSANPITDLPGPLAATPVAPLATFTIYDAAAFIENSNITATGNSGVQSFQFSYPFAGTQLAANTTYWIELANSTATATPTNLGGTYVTDTGLSGASPAGTGVAGNYWGSLFYEKIQSGECTAATGTPCSYLNGGSSGLNSITLGMEVQMPEPASMVLLGGGCFGLGLLRRRRRRPSAL